MRVTKLTIKNIGLIADESIELNKPLIVFYGEIRQGKTTILNAVRWVCGGSFPSDIIRHGQRDASIRLEFSGGMIERSFYVAKEGGTKARDIIFVRDGKPVKNPVAEIKRFLNPFLLDQDHLKNMTEAERRKYFTELFAVDTSDLDSEAFNANREAAELRAKIKGYGEIDLTPVEKVDSAPLIEQLRKIRADHEAARRDAAVKNDSIRSANRDVEEAEALVASADEEIGELEQQIASLRRDKAEREKWLKTHKRSPLVGEPVAPDTSALEEKISDTAVLKVRAEQYLKNVARDKDRKADSTRVSALEKRQREINAAKATKLKEVSGSCGIKGLVFDESGGFAYQGTQAGMLSTSQLMRLSSELSSMYPEGFGIELLDRGESLGRAIYEYVELAEQKQITVLATVVGERPAESPDRVGVFVIKDGVVIRDGEPAVVNA